VFHELTGFVHVDGDGTVGGLPWNFRAKYRTWNFAVASAAEREAWRVAWAPLGDGTRYEGGASRGPTCAAAPTTARCSASRTRSASSGSAPRTS